MRKDVIALNNRKAIAAAATVVCSAALCVTSAGAAHAAAPQCTPNVGNTGLSAAVVARPHQRIAHRTIDTSCDVGIYVGVGVRQVSIDHVRVSGANFQGIFAEKTSQLLIQNSTVTGNGFHTTDPAAPPLEGSGVKSFVGQSFAISLFGVSQSVVRNNTVYDNGRGGIGLMDNGPFDPGAMASHQNPQAPLVASSGDIVTGNRMWQNYGGCGLVAATQNFGGSLSGLVLTRNTVTGTGFSANGPDIGGIVVAADPPNSSVRNVVVSRNKVSGSFEGGVIVNAEAFNASTRNVWVTGNTLTANNYGAQEAPKTAGAIVFANPAAPVPPHANAPRNVFTVVVGNTIADQFYGIWSQGNDRPITLANHIQVTPGGTPIYHG